MHRSVDAIILAIGVAEFNAQDAAALGRAVWNTGCNSWYLTDTGSVDLWPFDRATMHKILETIDPNHFHIGSAMSVAIDADGTNPSEHSTKG